MSRSLHRTATATASLAKSRPILLLIAALAAVIAVSAVSFGSGTVSLASSSVVATAGIRQASSAEHQPVAAPNPVSPAAISPAELTTAQQAELTRLTDTPAKKVAFQAALTSAFRSVATVTFAPASQVHSHKGAASTEAFATGWSGDHWWMTMSYADGAGRAIDAAVAACRPRLGALCGVIGRLLNEWVAGWAPVANHGVWLAIYVYGRIDGGRW